MAPTAAARNLKVWVVSLGGKATGNEEQLIAACRKRLNLKFASFDESDAVAISAFAYGVTPLLGCLQDAVPVSQLQSFSKQVLAEHVFDAFKVLSLRTQLLEKYATVIDSDAAWQEVERLLQAAFGGTEMAPPPLADGAQLPALAPQLAPRWTHRWIVSGDIAGYSALLFQARLFLSEGRNKVFVFFGALGFLLSCWSASST